MDKLTDKSVVYNTRNGSLFAIKIGKEDFGDEEGSPEPTKAYTCLLCKITFCTAEAVCKHIALLHVKEKDLVAWPRDKAAPQEHVEYTYKGVTFYIKPYLKYEVSLLSDHPQKLQETSANASDLVVKPAADQRQSTSAVQDLKPSGTDFVNCNKTAVLVQLEDIVYNMPLEIALKIPGFLLCNEKGTLLNTPLEPVKLLLGQQQVELYFKPASLVYSAYEKIISLFSKNKDETPELIKNENVQKGKEAMDRSTFCPKIGMILPIMVGKVYLVIKVQAFNDLMFSLIALIFEWGLKYFGK